MTIRDIEARPVAVDLFAGAGGLSLGMEQAGFDVACAVEYDAIHAATHIYNFPDTDVLVASASDVTADAIRERTRVGARRVSLVAGGPPCQGFATIGKRALEDPRNRLVLDFVRLASELDTDYFVFENVKGMTMGHARRVIEEVIETAGELGYDVVAPYRVLNAKDFRVPQSRERLFVMGHRRGLPAPRYPVAVLETITCETAFEGLPDLDAFEALVEGDAVPFAFPEPVSPYARSMRPSSVEDWHHGRPRVWDRSTLTSSCRTLHTPEIAARFAATREGRAEPVSNFFRLPRHGIANTLRAGTDAKRGSFTSPRPIHYEHPRCVSVREMARLHGFPDWFRTHVTKAHGARQIGNAVPPPLARAVAGEFMRAIGYVPRPVAEPLPLGDEALLSLTAEAACERFGVDNLVGTRDRAKAA